MKKNKLFLIIAILFLLAVVIMTWHMASKTVKPWDKKKNDYLEKYSAPAYK